MLLKDLQRIPEFRHLAPTELAALASQVRLLCIPPNRWVIQEAVNQPAVHLYLLRGRLQRDAPYGIVRARSYGLLQAIYPCHGNIKTLSTVQLLVIDSARREFLMQRHSDSGANLAAEDGNLWLARFLDSALLRDIERHHWQHLVAAFTRRSFCNGEDVIAQGEAGDFCFVLERGHAVVHRGGRTLRHLNPGDFFGEDALILGTRRNATVTAIEPMVAHAIDRESFCKYLLSRVVCPVDVQHHGLRVKLDRHFMAQLREKAAVYRPGKTLYISGLGLAERTLAAFVFLQCGLQAHPLTEDSESTGVSVNS